MENEFKESIDSIFENLEKFIKTETVIGEPIVVGEVTLVPVISVMFGCGAGGGAGTDDKGMKGNGNGGGGGARISPNGIVVIKKDGDVSLLPIKNKSSLESLINMVPEIVSKININKDGKDNKEKDSEEEN